MKKLLLLLLLLVGIVFINFSPTAEARATGTEVRDDLEKYFGGFTGTFMMYETAGNRHIIYNEPQRGKPLPPCSTFKIYNSLIGLETGVLDTADANTLFKKKLKILQPDK